MALSRRLRRVITRIGVLEDHFLPKVFSLSGQYTKRQRDHTKAYLVLVHAELESYFEDRARYIADRAQERWNNHGECTPALSRMLVYHHSCEKDELEPASAQAVTKAVNYFENNVLDKNHGVSPKHIRAMLLPLGIEHDDFDSQLTLALEQLARKRGQFAHASFKAHQAIDPKTERDNIHNNIIPKLKKMDQRLTEIR
jgi:hypothetical protein